MQYVVLDMNFVAIMGRTALEALLELGQPLP